MLHCHTTAEEMGKWNFAPTHDQAYRRRSGVKDADPIMTQRNIIVVGASAGGVEALIQLVQDLPSSVPATLFVVVHVPAAYPSTLPAILSRVGNLPAMHAEDGAQALPGHIYVAPPDYHLVLEDGAMRLSHGPRENHCRPAIDPLFRTAAQEYGPRVAGVVLSGTLYDGTSGLAAVKRGGGVTIVQDPEEARFPGMPQNAITWDHPDLVLPLSEVAATLAHLATGSAQKSSKAKKGKDHAGTK